MAYWLHYVNSVMVSGPEADMAIQEQTDALAIAATEYKEKTIELQQAKDNRANAIAERDAKIAKLEREQEERFQRSNGYINSVSDIMQWENSYWDVAEEIDPGIELQVEGEWIFNIQ